jgi:hypothetical protein
MKLFTIAFRCLQAKASNGKQVQKKMQRFSLHFPVISKNDF